VLIKNAQHLQASLARLTGRRIAQAYCRFSREATHSVLVALVNTLTLNLTPLLLANYYSATDYGYYALMSRLAMLPSNLLASAIGQSFWSEAARLVKVNPSELRRLYLKTTLRLTGLAAVASGICLGGPFYVEHVFGSPWAGAGTTLAAMAPWVFGQFVVSPLSHLVVHRKQNWQLVWDACRFILLMALIAYCVTEGVSMNMTILSISTVMLAMYGVLFIMNLGNLKR
jgi:O-antigen/teichoic acid export membrane protein